MSTASLHVCGLRITLILSTFTMAFRCPLARHLTEMCLPLGLRCCLCVQSLHAYPRFGSELSQQEWSPSIAPPKTGHSSKGGGAGERFHPPLLQNTTIDLPGTLHGHLLNLVLYTI